MIWSPAMQAALQWPEQRTVSEWADAHRYLDSRTSSMPGQWDTNRVPHAREWMDSASCSWVRQITIVAGTQIAKTETLLNIAAWSICQDPGPIVWVMPSGDMADHFAQNRIAPMVECTPALAAELGGERWDAKKQAFRFSRANLWMRSARVPSELSSDPCRYVIADECNKYPEWSGKEAQPWELVTERTRTFWNHLWICTSTPTVPGGLVSREHLKGDRRSYHVPCPHCGAWQVLRFPQIKWNKERDDTEAKIQATRDAWYECEACQKPIDDRQKLEACRRGVWVPAEWKLADWLNRGQAEDRAPHRSYHCWAGYSPWVSWWEIVAKYLRSKDDPALMQNFVNSWLGEAWQEKVEEATDDQAKACRRPYSHGQTPEGPIIVVAGVDTQAHYLPYSVRGFGLDGNSWLLDHGRAKDFDALEAALMRQDFSRGDSRRPFLTMRLVLVDARYREGDAVDFARKWGGIVKLTKGSEFGDARTFGSVHTLERHPVTGAPLHGDGVQLWSVNTGAFKDRLAVSMRRGAEGASSRALHIYQDIDETYLAEVTSEHKVTVRTQNATAQRWVKKPGRRANHFLDTETLCFAAADMLRVDQLRQSHQRNEARERHRKPDSGGGGGGGPGLLWRRN